MSVAGPDNSLLSLKTRRVSPLLIFVFIAPYVKRIRIKFDAHEPAGYSLSAFVILFIHAILMNNFNQLLRQIEARLSPLHNLHFETKHVPQAAVTLILRESQDETQLLIIKRAEFEGDPWSGHLALPGGRAETIDADLLATAARETHEEIGINLNNGGRFIGQLPIIDTRNSLLPQLEITPFVAIAPVVFSMQLSSEVANVFWVPIDHLKREGASIEYQFTQGDLIMKRPAYPCEGGPIWGITERILTSFFSLLDKIPE
jgi:8-oxo-dGTP pyrophosphatase MutT (NUDIX family)